MTRLARYVIPGQPQHIIQRGNNRQVIFAADAGYQFFRDALVGAASKHGLNIHAYAWMTNHVHILATSEFGHSISKVFQSVGRRYLRLGHDASDRQGAYWLLFRAAIPGSDLKEIRECTHKGWALGSA